MTTSIQPLHSKRYKPATAAAAEVFSVLDESFAGIPKENNGFTSFPAPSDREPIDGNVGALWKNDQYEINFHSHKLCNIEWVKINHIIYTEQLPHSLRNAITKERRMKTPDRSEMSGLVCRIKRNATISIAEDREGEREQLLGQNRTG